MKPIQNVMLTADSPEFSLLRLGFLKSSSAMRPEARFKIPLSFLISCSAIDWKVPGEQSTHLQMQIKGT
jgi:hypothetical protein